MTLLFMTIFGPPKQSSALGSVGRFLVCMTTILRYLIQIAGRVRSTVATRPLSWGLGRSQLHVSTPMGRTLSKWFPCVLHSVTKRGCCLASTCVLGWNTSHLYSQPSSALSGAGGDGEHVERAHGHLGECKHLTGASPRLFFAHQPYMLTNPGSAPFNIFLIYTRVIFNFLANAVPPLPVGLLRLVHFFRHSPEEAVAIRQYVINGSPV